MAEDQPNRKFEWLLKALPLLPFAAGVYAVISGKTYLGSAEGPPLDRVSATAIGVFLIGVALFMHVHFSWSAKPEELVWTKAVKCVAALASLAGMAFLAIHLGAFGRA